MWHDVTRCGSISLSYSAASAGAVVVAATRPRSSSHRCWEAARNARMLFRYVRTRRRTPIAVGTARRTVSHRTFIFGMSRPGGILPKTLSSAPSRLATRRALAMAYTGVRFM